MKNHPDTDNADVYPVPQNALYVSAGMNVLKFPGGKPKATDVSPWYRVYRADFSSPRSEKRSRVSPPIPTSWNGARISENIFYQVL